VEPFLFNLFSDPDIIRLPVPFIQKPLAWLLAKRRAPKSQEAYASIGGGSPLLKITNQQAEAVKKALDDKGLEVSTYVAMRYWSPTTETALE
jgi:protoporphyrin/coproporphyrin ferrochelatase